MYSVTKCIILVFAVLYHRWLSYVLHAMIAVMKSLAGLLFLLSVLQAAGPTLGMVQNIHSNRYIEFSLGKLSYTTQPYGVLTLEELAFHSVMPSECREHIADYYRRYPLKRHFAQKYLKIGQLYHIQPRHKSAIIYASGMSSYGELLLAEGLAMREPLLMDKEWAYRFRKIQKVARLEKRGLWAENIWIDCVASLYKDEEDEDEDE